MEIMRWCLPAQKTRFQIRIWNVLLGKFHIGVGRLVTPFTSDVKNYFQGSKGT